MKKIILSIDGMTCSACSNGLEKYLNKQNGVFNASVNLVLANASIEYDENILDIEKLEKYVAQAGFKSLGEFKEIKLEKNNKVTKVKFIVFTFLAIFLMYMSMGHMVGLPSVYLLDPYINTFNYMIVSLLIAISFIWYGFDILKNGYKNLIHKTPNMDTLVGIGVITSFLYSIYNMYLMISGKTMLVMNLYFESTAIVIYFIKLGRYIDGISKDKTKEAIKKLVEITPNKAIVKKDGIEKEVTLDEIHKGDILISRAGDKIAVDGEIVLGTAHLDEAFITGESKPAQKNIGDKIIAGSINYNGYIEYKAEKIGRESTISEIVRLVVEATNTKAPIARIADKVSGIFVPVVILVAIISFIIYLIIGAGLEKALMTFVTILVVACPCSLGLATPLAIVVSEGKSAGKGILIKKSEILENAEKVKTVVFDKTGTLTYGKLKISKILKYDEIDEKTLIEKVGSIEAKGTHPIGKAFLDYMIENNIEKVNVDEVENIAGFGIRGVINNQEILIGSFKLLDKYNVKNNHKDDEKLLAENGNSIVWVSIDNKVVALIGVKDIVRDESKDVVEKLKSNKFDVIMLTGDNEETAKKIAREIGITNIIANVLPKDKLNIIKNLKEDKKLVMMCGDGINDSPALATADIGVSVNSGTDIAMDSSDVILIKNDLNSIIDLIEISKKTVKIIKQNLFWAFFYNCLMIPIAIGLFKSIGILINPMVASFAMVISSITVILNTLRLKK